MGRLGYGTTLAATLWALSACQLRAPSISDPMHSINAPTRDDTTWLWTASPRAVAVRAAGSILPGAKPVDDGHEARQRAQWWLDRFDVTMRTRHPQELANVPKPQALVMKARSPDAFAMSSGVCYDVPVILAATPSANGTQDWPAVAVTGDLLATGFDPRNAGGANVTPMDPLRPDTCTPRHLDPKDVPAFVAWFNGFMSRCKLEARLDGGGQATGEVALGQGCVTDGRVAASVASRPRAKSLMIPSMSDWIAFSDKLLQVYADDLDFATVASHELGHYYRAHLLAPAEEYSFLYDQDRGVPDPDKRPVPPSDAKERKTLADLADAFRSLEPIFGNLAPVPGQKVRTEIFAALVSVVDGRVRDAAFCAAGTACRRACDPLLAIMDAPGFQSPTGYFGSRFPHGPLAGASLKSYQGFEAALLACAPAVPFAATGAQGLTNMGFLQDVQLADRAGAIFSQFPSFATLADAITFMNGKYDDLDAKLQNAHAEAKAKRLGFYTAEQEADELGLEIAYHAGVPTDKAASQIFALGRTREAEQGEPRPPEMSIDACAALRRAGWDDGSGSPAYVALGKLSDPHHSYCFRAFNMDRETARHGYAARPGQTAPHPGGKPWTQVMGSL